VVCPDGLARGIKMNILQSSEEGYECMVKMSVCEIKSEESTIVVFIS
jgi:hypothetical protein